MHEHFSVNKTLTQVKENQIKVKKGEKIKDLSCFLDTDGCETKAIKDQENVCKDTLNIPLNLFIGTLSMEGKTEQSWCMSHLLMIIVI